MVNEQDGRTVLKQVFVERGYDVLDDYDFEEGGLKFNADGWDPEKRVGFEFMTIADRDHEDLNPDTLLRLQEWTQSGRLAFLFIDETDISDRDDLIRQAHAFLDDVKR